MHRREFLARAGLGVVAATAAMREASGQALLPKPTHRNTLFFTSAGKTCLINVDGSGFRTLDVDAPRQKTWQPCGFFKDGRVLMLSMEARRDGPGKPFEKFYHQTPTHIWIHDLETGALDEIVTQDRLAPFYTPALLLPEDRLLVQVVRDEGGQIFNVALDGSDARPFTQLGEGLPYGFSLRPDGRRVAYHIATPQGYQIFTSDTTGANRTCVAADPNFLFFGPQWSHDGEWLVFQGCDYQNDPGHDWADLWIARPDGKELRRLTEGQSAWFAATYGPKKRPGGGSNVPVWRRDGAILFARRTPGARVPWQYRTGKPDLDHFNRKYTPKQAKGGTDICALTPHDGGNPQVLGEARPGLWNFRMAAHPDHIAYCRCETGASPELWCMDVFGGNERCLSKGLHNEGADHPRWVPQKPEIAVCYF